MAEIAKEVQNLDSLIVGQLYSFPGIVKRIERDGEEETRKPIIVLLQFEKSKLMIKMSSWDYSALSIFKNAQEKRLICNFTFKMRPYKETMAYNIQSIEVTNKVTSIPEDPSYADSEDGKQIIAWTTQLIDDFVSSTNNEYKKLLDHLVLNNKHFFSWQAAKSYHHAFEGGLGLHSYMVCNNAIMIAKQYDGMRGFQIDYPLLVTGAILHDIGKLVEYEEDGNFSFYGNLMSHMVIGVEMIDDACDELGINKYSNDIIKLKHIIVSHHGKLEFGSPNQPALPEAVIVSRADKLDAECEGMLEALEITQASRRSIGIKCLDGMSVYKFYSDNEE